MAEKNCNSTKQPDSRAIPIVVVSKSDAVVLPTIASKRRKVGASLRLTVDPVQATLVLPDASY